MYSNNLICDILIYIHDNISNKITVNELEKRFFYNRYYIMKLFKKEIGLTIIEYINSIRIYNSILLLKNHNNNLTNIAICGILLFYTFLSLFQYFLSKKMEMPWKIFVRTIVLFMLLWWFE